MPAPPVQKITLLSGGSFDQWRTQEWGVLRVLTKDAVFPGIAHVFILRNRHNEVLLLRQLVKCTRSTGRSIQKEKGGGQYMRICLCDYREDASSRRPAGNVVSSAAPGLLHWEGCEHQEADHRHLQDLTMTSSQFSPFGFAAVRMLVM